MDKSSSPFQPIKALRIRKANKDMIKMEKYQWQKILQQIKYIEKDYGGKG
jgi:hypothetical protein